MSTTGSSIEMRVGIAILFLGILSACGGGGGSGSSSTPAPLPPANNPPLISGSPSTTVTEGQPYSFTPVASDPDRDTLTFAISILPLWARFDSGTGSLTGTPETAHVGTTPGVTISVSDGTVSASLTPFDLEVRPNTAPNTAPSVTSPGAQSTEVGSSVNLSIVASDIDDDTLSYSATGLPSGLSIASGTGVISGTPGIAGSNAVSVSVSDGSESTVVGFGWEITEIRLGSATVSWDVPTTNADGSLLTDLAGFRVHYRDALGVYSRTAIINDASATSVLIDELEPGTWFFAVTAVDLADNESAPSAEVSKVVSP